MEDTDRVLDRTQSGYGRDEATLTAGSIAVASHATFIGPPIRLKVGLSVSDARVRSEEGVSGLPNV